MIAGGASAEVIAQARQMETVEEDQAFDVYEENWLSFSLFCEMETQWEVIAGMGGVHYSGIKYPSLESAMRLRRVPLNDRARIFQDVRLMERAAKSVLNDK